VSSLPRRIVLASSNAGKLREIARILAEFGMEIVPQSALGVGDADETGGSFVENALIKARHAMQATGLAAIGDDSGISVDALAGRPGVYSSRYAGPQATDDDNNDKLLRELDGVADAERGATFHCAACLVTPDGDTLVAEGSWRGSILRERSGSGGFGYDPLFYVAATGCSSAQLDADEKNRLSHRGQALRRLAEQIRARESSR
jgi:XTP/dITP diphosphohydrolase